MTRAKPKPVAIEDLAADLGIAESDARKMLQSESAPIAPDYRGRPAVPPAYIARLSARDDYGLAVRRAVTSEMLSRDNGSEREMALLRSRRYSTLLEYDGYLETLETLHRKYLSAANEAGAESAGMAAFLLLSRAIAIIKMACVCLRAGHWYSGAMLREIDECLDLASYFSIKRDSTEGATALHKWFRENEAPSHRRCRETISDWRASIVSDQTPDYHLDLMRELYRKKSKWIHPTFLAIREVAQYDVRDSLMLTVPDYGPCTYELKLLELTEFFRSSIWSTFQTLWLSFLHLFALAQADVEVLRQHDLLLQSKTGR